MGTRAMNGPVMPLALCLKAQHQNAQARVSLVKAPHDFGRPAGGRSLHQQKRRSLADQSFKSKVNSFFPDFTSAVRSDVLGEPYLGGT